MSDQTNVKSEPTGESAANEPQLECEGPLGSTACSAFSLVEALILAEAIKPPFVLSVTSADTEAGAWYVVVNGGADCCAIKPEIIIRKLGLQYGGTLAEGLRGDPQHMPESLTPLARRLIHTIQGLGETIQRQVLETLESLGTQTK